MSEPPKTEPKTLQFSNSEILCGLGIILFCVSLAIPAIKHGKDCLGIECFTTGLVCIIGPANSPSGGELRLMSLIAHLMHISASIPIFDVWNRKNVDLPWKLLPCFFALICIAILLTIPYSSIETVYAGYYIWLSSIGIIAFAPFVPPDRGATIL